MIIGSFDIQIFQAMCGNSNQQLVLKFNGIHLPTKTKPQNLNHNRIVLLSLWSENTAFDN